MLEELHARDLALIEETWLEFGSGMTVLTGETGAGKTVLLGALKLLLGERADSGAVRTGSTEALVEGRFLSGDAETVVRRRVGADGRSRCTLDGEMATVGALAERLGPLVDLHGQHEHQALLSPSTHVGYLDRWAGAEAQQLLESYRVALEEWRIADNESRALAERIERARFDAEQLRFTVSEIERVSPEPREDEALQARLPALIHAEKLSEAASEVAHALRGDGGALDGLGTAMAALERIAGIDPTLDSIAERLAEVNALLDDASVSARTYRDQVEHDPVAIDALQARLSALAGLTKRFGPTLGDVLSRLEDAREVLQQVESGSAALDEATESAALCRRTLESAQRRLADVRSAAAPGFCSALAEAASDLAMEGARFEVSFVDVDFGTWAGEGGQRVEFLYGPAPRQAARPLSRIASGGELSRVMLALKGVLGSADQVETLVFDEVDAGIGGATAGAVGARLSALSGTHQVIVVTHLAQVAAFADSHFVVRKLVDEEGGVATTVVPVEGDDRIAEIARMLSGEVSPTSRAHAAELLASAGRAVSAG